MRRVRSVSSITFDILVKCLLMSLKKKRMNDTRSTTSPLLRGWKPNVLALGFGGMKGYLELGALNYLESIDLLDSLDKVVGCSVGSIIGLMIVVGYTSDEIVTESLGTSLLSDISQINVKRAINNSGLISNESMRIKISEMVVNKIGVVPSLLELYEMKGIAFSAVTYNSSKCQSVHLTHATHPNMSCVDAVLYSSHIPYLFFKVSYDGDTYIDGAYGSPYPVDLFDDGKNNILGLYIEEVKYDGVSSNDSDEFIQQSVMYFNTVIFAPLHEHRKRIVSHSSSHVEHIALTPLPTIQDLSFTLEERKQMVENGRECASMWYNGTVNDSIDEREVPLQSTKEQEYKLPPTYQRHDQLFGSSFLPSQVRRIHSSQVGNGRVLTTVYPHQSHNRSMNTYDQISKSLQSL